MNDHILMVGHRADGTISCSACGILAENVPFPCDHSTEDEHIRS